RGGLVDGAARQDQRCGDQRPPWQVDRDHGEPVRQLPALELREMERPRLARCRAIGDDDLVRHAAAPPAAASPSAAPVAGTYVSTYRLSATKTSRQTARICSAVVDRYRSR